MSTGYLDGLPKSRFVGSRRFRGGRDCTEIVCALDLDTGGIEFVGKLFEAPRRMFDVTVGHSVTPCRLTDSPRQGSLSIQ